MWVKKFYESRIFDCLNRRFTDELPTCPWPSTFHEHTGIVIRPPMRCFGAIRYGIAPNCSRKRRVDCGPCRTYNVVTIVEACTSTTKWNENIVISTKRRVNFFAIKETSIFASMITKRKKPGKHKISKWTYRLRFILEGTWLRTFMWAIDRLFYLFLLSKVLISGWDERLDLINRISR